MNTTAENNNWYFAVAGIVGAITFITIWAFMIQDWGLGLGIIFGWIPAGIGGAIVGIAWPLVLGIIALAVTHII